MTKMNVFRADKARAEAVTSHRAGCGARCGLGAAGLAGAVVILALAAPQASAAGGGTIAAIVDDDLETVESNRDSLTEYANAGGTIAAIVDGDLVTVKRNPDGLTEHTTYDLVAGASPRALAKRWGLP